MFLSHFFHCFIFATSCTSLFPYTSSSLPIYPSLLSAVFHPRFFASATSHLRYLPSPPHINTSSAPPPSLAPSSWPHYKRPLPRTPIRTHSPLPPLFILSSSLNLRPPRPHTSRSSLGSPHPSFMSANPPARRFSLPPLPRSSLLVTSSSYILGCSYPSVLRPAC